MVFTLDKIVQSLAYIKHNTQGHQKKSIFFQHLTISFQYLYA